jgi:hypothetical protein
MIKIPRNQNSQIKNILYPDASKKPIKNHHQQNINKIKQQENINRIKRQEKENYIPRTLS